MHLELVQGNWIVRHLRDDGLLQEKVIQNHFSTASGSPLDSDKPKLEDKLGECSYLRLSRNTEKYIAEIHIYEQEHDQRIEVEGEIFTSRIIGEERTLTETIYLKNCEFIGDKVKMRASEYAKKIQSEIDSILDSSTSE